ncbi:hypothetical protein GCM10023322_82550 [Rugosimonospora acidiphila]|uniref:Uncharacterized protein n=1 Tax=Rugosimonospora acidiphila TaxID=556531 RepID=A0ABP9ST32_9ACTN
MCDILSCTPNDLIEIEVVNTAGVGEDLHVDAVPLVLARVVGPSSASIVHYTSLP